MRTARRRAIPSKTGLKNASSIRYPSDVLSSTEFRNGGDNRETRYEYCENSYEYPSHKKGYKWLNN